MPLNILEQDRFGLEVLLVSNIFPCPSTCAAWDVVASNLCINLTLVASPNRAWGPTKMLVDARYGAFYSRNGANKGTLMKLVWPRFII